MIFRLVEDKDNKSLKDLYIQFNLGDIFEQGGLFFELYKANPTSDNKRQLIALMSDLKDLKRQVTNMYFEKMVSKDVRNAFNKNIDIFIKNHSVE